MTKAEVQAFKSIITPVDNEESNLLCPVSNFTGVHRDHTSYSNSQFLFVLVNAVLAFRDECIFPLEIRKQYWNTFILDI